MEIYELADVARIVGIEKSRVKNWTLGRPFTVKPSLRSSFGTGSRNLFSRQDLYCFALVQRLIEADAPVAAIQRMLEKLRPDLPEDAFWKEQKWIIISRKDRDRSYDVNYGAEYPASSTVQPEEHEFLCHYAVNLKSLAHEVANRIDQFMHQLGVREDE